MILKALADEALTLASGNMSSDFLSSFLPSKYGGKVQSNASLLALSKPKSNPSRPSEQKHIGPTSDDPSNRAFIADDATPPPKESRIDDSNLVSDNTEDRISSKRRMVEESDDDSEDGEEAIVVPISHQAVMKDHAKVY